MFAWSTATRICLALGATGLRQGFDSLNTLVGRRLEPDPLNRPIAGVFGRTPAHPVPPQRKENRRRTVEFAR